MAKFNRTNTEIAHVYRGTFIHSTQQAAVQILEDALLGVDTEGKIAFIGKGTEQDRLCQTFGFNLSEITQLAQHEFFMPGLVDTHIHASQYSYAGTALDMPLLQWLNTYTFPVESRFKDLEFANRVYTKVVRNIFMFKTKILTHFENDFGQRALVGKVCMDRNNSVKHYKETSQESQEETCRLCSGVLNVRKVLKHKVRLGLGTDVAGGYSASILDAIRRALESSKVLTIQDPEYDTLTFEEVFRLATLGGSQALSLDDQTGNFEVGKDFDALRVNVAAPGGPIDLIQSEEPKILLEKFLNLGDDRNIVQVFVAGRKVVPFTDATPE
ncbi:Guanine deaminase [Nibea albiflora]|uniref:Guanine deaminase n=1 Tax=Nibea albiflora TaxID=240163 RepID=A0ACB7FDQ6_NIBAL|nr:Guanine deaminase [Nibea albiflora]